MIALALLVATAPCAPADTLYVVDSTAVLASMTAGVDPARRVEHARFLHEQVIGWQAELIRQRARALGLEVTVVTTAEGFTLAGKDAALDADVTTRPPRIALHAVVDDPRWPRAASKKVKGRERAEQYVSLGGKQRIVTVVEMAPQSRAAFAQALTAAPGKRLAFELVDASAAGAQLEARLLEDPPVMVASDFADGRQSGPEVLLTTTASGKAKLTATTQALAGRRLAILVDDEIVQVPVVGDAITSGTVGITSGGSNDQEKRTRAAKLAGQVKLALHPLSIATRCLR